MQAACSRSKGTRLRPLLPNLLLRPASVTAFSIPGRSESEITPRGCQISRQCLAADRIKRHRLSRAKGLQDVTCWAVFGPFDSWEDGSWALRRSRDEGAVHCGEYGQDLPGSRQKYRWPWRISTGRPRPPCSNHANPGRTASVRASPVRSATSDCAWSG
jgi:hypothetical protein